MALNRNHSQEGGVVIPNAERYRGSRRSSSLPVPSSGLGRRCSVGGGGDSRWGDPPFPARPRRPGLAWGVRY